MHSYKPEVSRFKLEKELSSFYQRDVSQLSAQEVLYFFYGDYSGERDSRDCDYSVVDKHYKPYKTTIYQRLSWVVVVPVVLLTLPFLWIATGEWGYRSDWKITKLLHKITGL